MWIVLSMTDNLKKKVDTIVGLSRMAGGILIIIGCIIVFFMARAALDPAAVIEINGVPTSDESKKIQAAISTGFIPLLGLFLAFLPDKYADKWVASLVRFFR
jgi:uncharacterized membrane protein